MSQDANIQYLLHREIDRAMWDKCMDEAGNGLIYGYSYYLDHMAKHWDALVCNGYERVMPLTWNKKFGFHYLYQPAFTASLGVFGQDPNEEIVTQFIRLIPPKFRLIEISLNHENSIGPSLPFVISRINYVLPLQKPYESLLNDYRENHRRNIHKALHAGCVVKKNIPVEEVIALNKQQLQGSRSLADSDYNRLKLLYQFLFDQGKASSYAVADAGGKVLASCIFFFSHKRAFYILAGNHPDGRSLGASHAVIDAFIKDRAGEDMVLDFEGSDIEGLALFYSGFGATKETYPAIRWNRLPWYARWMKNRDQ